MRAPGFPHPEHENVLKLLREVTGSPELTQRELAKRMGISLGKVNFLLKALVGKGLVKVHNFRKADNRSAYLYYLTPRDSRKKPESLIIF
jgi:EPS-associated MarR family transcriptional regulator